MKAIALLLALTDSTGPLDFENESLCALLEEEIAQVDTAGRIENASYFRVFNRKVEIPAESMLVSYRDEYAQFLRYSTNSEKDAAIRVGKINSSVDMEEYVERNKSQMCQEYIADINIEVSVGHFGKAGTHYNVRIFNNEEYISINSETFSVAADIISSLRRSELTE